MKQGAIVIYEGFPHRVLRVTESRAVLEPTEPATVRFRAIGGRVISFKRRRALVSISPNSELPEAQS